MAEMVLKKKMNFHTILSVRWNFPEYDSYKELETLTIIIYEEVNTHNKM